MNEETKAGPRCTHCGNDGSRAALFLSIDARWRPEAGAWELQERDDSGGVELDCLECDGQTECDRAALFPYGRTIQPPGGARLMRAGDLMHWTDPAATWAIESAADAGQLFEGGAA